MCGSLSEKCNFLLPATTFFLSHDVAAYSNHVYASSELLIDC